LNPGEYVQFTLRRQNDIGAIGVSAFGTTHVSATAAANSSLLAGSTTISFAADGSNPTYNWDATQTLGFRLDSADGALATISYYSTAATADRGCTRRRARLSTT